jgi:hypothetical protein
LLILYRVFFFFGGEIPSVGFPSISPFVDDMM